MPETLVASSRRYCLLTLKLVLLCGNPALLEPFFSDRSDRSDSEVMEAIFSTVPRDRWSITPIGRTPPGVQRNLHNPPDAGPAWFGVSTALFAVASFFFGLRLYSKGFLLKKFTVDDCKRTMHAALLAFLTLSVLCAISFVGFET